MRKYVFIGIGGFLGAISRFLIKGIQISHYYGNIPLNTLIINVTGSFILALILTVTFKNIDFHADIRLGITTGFFGAYTTFSTLCKETVGLMQQGFYYSALMYVTVSIVLGLVSVYLAIILARKIVFIIARKDNESNKLVEDIVDIEEGVE